MVNLFRSIKVELDSTRWKRAARRQRNYLAAATIESKERPAVCNEILYFRRITPPKMLARLNLTDEFLGVQAVAELHRDV